MRLDINLASQPYEDARQFWMRWGTAVGAAGVATLVLLALTITGWVNARRDHQAMAEKRAMIADRDRIRGNAEDFLNRPENRNTRDISQFLNQLIERKAFSWTRVLENLEKVMPARVHLVAIHPELDEDNQLALKMTVAGDSRDRAIELARRMEESKRFAQTNITGGRAQQSTTGDTEQVDLVAIYITEPVIAAVPATADTKTAGDPFAGDKATSDRPVTAGKKSATNKSATDKTAPNKTRPNPKPGLTSPAGGNR
jgi:type IV pilus assembly protein PilN